MAKKKRTKTQRTRPRGRVVHRRGRAPAHGELVDDRVRVFVDDQNLFWGIVNKQYGPRFRIDFGRLLTVACRRTGGMTRFVKSAYIAGVIPDDDSFWKIAENQGFTVRRGYLGARARTNAPSRMTPT